MCQVLINTPAGRRCGSGFDNNPGGRRGSCLMSNPGERGDEGKSLMNNP